MIYILIRIYHFVLVNIIHTCFISLIFVSDDCSPKLTVKLNRNSAITTKCKYFYWKSFCAGFMQLELITFD